MSQTPIGPDYNYPLGKVTITASQVNTKITVSLGGRFQQDVWIEANNETPYVITIFSLQGILLNSIQPQFVDITQIPSGDSAFIIVPTLLIPQAAPSSEVDINVYPFKKPSGTYPSPLNRQSAATSPADQSSGFVANQLFTTTPTANNAFGINIFNPANSGVNMHVYQARVSFAAAYTVAGSVPFLAMGFTIGPDNNFAGGTFNIQPNNTTAVSKCRATFTTNSNILAGTNWEQHNLAISLAQTLNLPPFDLMPFPDQKLIPPGTNISIICKPIAAVNTVGDMTLKWVEL